MLISRTSLRWAALAGLWTLVAYIGFLMAVQFLLMVLTPAGTWHLPRIYQVTVRAFEADPQTEYPAIYVKDRADREQVIFLLKQERASLSVDQELWVLDNCYRTRLRPSQFKLTPVRLLIEFPEPLLVLALVLIWRVRKTQARVAKALRETPRERTVLRDDFHARAQRFAPPKEPKDQG